MNLKPGEWARTPSGGIVYRATAESEAATMGAARTYLRQKGALRALERLEGGL